MENEQQTTELFNPYDSQKELMDLLRSDSRFTFYIGGRGGRGCIMGNTLIRNWIMQYYGERETTKPSR